MFSETLQNAMNEQINKELHSAYIYLSMAAYFDSMNLPGFAHWMRMQYQEEVGHAMRFYTFINERGGRVILEAIEQPPVEFLSAQDVFEKTLAHEQYITGCINDIYALAVKENDYASQNFLNWFVEEQVEEEATAAEILETLRMVGDKGHALVMMDRQMGRRGGD